MVWENKQQVYIYVYDIITIYRKQLRREIVISLLHLLPVEEIVENQMKTFVIN